jgi:peptide/nickel transport system substrate-binding protein
MKRVISTVLAAGLLLGASSAVLAVERGGTLAYGRYADSLFLEPVLNDANVDIWVLSNLYDTLILPSDDGQGLVPGLATEWKVSNDGLTVTLTMRDGIKFSDGSPITTEDVKWSLERAATPDNGIWQFLVDSIASVAAPNDKTAVITLKHPDPAILSALTVFNTAIMPKKLFEAEPGATDKEKAQSFATHPVGSGPFMFQSWDKGSDMKLVKNPYYWDKGEDGQPLPYLDGIDFQVIPDDATRILKLQSGELQGGEFIPYSRVKELQDGGTPADRWQGQPAEQ